MKPILKFCIITAALLLTACATGPRKVSMSEAVAPANSIPHAIKNEIAQSPEKLYTQPANKTTPCKLPTSKDQLQRKNFRAYWDGDCKDGYAYGLGRDIALSDTHHFEEITIHNGDGDSIGQPAKFIDYVQNFSALSVSNLEDLASAKYLEQIQYNGTNFFIEYRIIAEDKIGNSWFLNWSPLNPSKVTINRSSGNPDYVMVDYSALPATSDQAKMALFTADPATGKPFGFRIVRFRNGTIQHQKLAADGQTVIEQVELPQEYITRLTKAMSDAQAAVQKAGAAAAKAQQMEREYLHMACAADYSIKGVPPKDMEIARQICTWRDQWKEPFAQAETKYKHEIERKQQEVAQAEQQRAYIAAQQAQAAAAEKAAFAASMTQLNQTLQQQNNNTMQQINQMNQQLQQQNNQMMNSWAPQQNKTTICNRIGNQVFCR
ncbi:MAG: hypothetical protein RJB68_211 [Pseudomonadota bacterium]|jgi:hypothetical protein